MRNKIISTFRTVILAAVLAACGSDDKIDSIDTPANSVVIRAGIDNGLARSGSLTVPDGYKPRHVIEVWSTGDNPRPIHREEQVTTGSEPVVFNFKLTDGGNYKALLWTDFVEKDAGTREINLNSGQTPITYTHHEDCHYKTVDNLKNIAILHAGTGYTVNDESRDAFFACVDIVKGAEAYNQDVTLKRPFGQLNIIEKNPNTPAGVATMTLAYSVPGTFDVETGTPGPATLAVNPTVTTLPVPTATRKANLFYDYIFAPAPNAQTTLGQIAMTFTGNGFDYDDFTVPALLPVARNRRTNVSGSILYSKNASITVSVSDSWDNTSVDMNLVFIPDPAFREFCIDKGYADADGYLFIDKAAAVTGTLDVKKQLGDNRITSLAGIEYFTNITGLNCNYNALTTLDMSKNTKLKTLECRGNNLTTLEVSANTKLQTLDCGSTSSLGQLDVTRNTELVTLICDGNNLTTLDVSKNTKLEYLECSGNRSLGQLDMKQNTELTGLLCDNNNLTTLDVSKNTKLQKLNCSNNPLLEQLDVKQNTELVTLLCRANNLKALEVSANTKLETLNCSNNPSLGQLDVTRNTELTGLYCSNNNLTTLDVSKNTKLQTLNCSDNRINQLDVTRNTALVELQCHENRIATLDASGMTKDPANNTWYLSCGLQTNDIYSYILLVLTLREDQKSYWESILKGKSENQNVIVY